MAVAIVFDSRYKYYMHPDVISAVNNRQVGKYTWVQIEMKDNLIGNLRTEAEYDILEISFRVNIIQNLKRLGYHNER